ncbi:hypothetical protein Q4R27_16165 [Morganella morganii subsp. sibonii]
MININNSQMRAISFFICVSYSVNVTAAVAINDNGTKTAASGTASITGSSGGAATTASQNAIAMTGDADYNAIDTSKFTLESIYGKDGNYSGGIFGFGVETSAKTYSQNANSNGSVSPGQQAYKSGAYTLGMINFLAANKSASRGTQAFGINSNAFGQGAQANGYVANALGQQATASGSASNAIGLLASATGQGSIAIGLNSNASNTDTISLGTLSDSIGKSSVSIGSQSKATNDGDVAIGYQSTTKSVINNNGISLGNKNYSFAGADATSAMAIGNRQLQQVAAGEISELSTDAVNGSQLNAAISFSQENESKINKNSANIAANKADADTRFDSQGKLISNNTDAIGKNTTAITANTSAISKNSDTIAANKADADTRFDSQGKLISNNTSAIAVNTDAIDKMNIDINTNTSTINKNSNNITANKIDTDTKLGALGNRV